MGCVKGCGLRHFNIIRQKYRVKKREQEWNNILEWGGILSVSLEKEKCGGHIEGE